jgi:hypothetical protein
MNMQNEYGLCVNCLHNKYIIECKFCNNKHFININKYCSKCNFCCRNDYYDVCGLHNELYIRSDIKIKCSLAPTSVELGDLHKEINYKLCEICKLDKTAYFIDCISCSTNHSKYYFCSKCKHCNQKYNNNHLCKIKLCDRILNNIFSFCFSNNNELYYNNLHKKMI